MPSLPRQDDALVKSLPGNARSAYLEHVLPAEDAAQTASVKPRQCLHVRILGALLIHAPDWDTCDTMVREIISTNGSYSKLDELGKFYLEHFIFPFRRNKCRTPPPTNHPSPSWSSPDVSRRFATQEELLQTPQHHSSAKQNALIRDGFRCMLSGMIDARVWADNITAFPPAQIMPTKCCHILPTSTNRLSCIKDTEDEAHRPDGLWAALHRSSGYRDMRKAVKGPAGHQLSNILTLSSHLQARFNDLRLWLEAIPGEEHSYHVRTHPPDAIAHLGCKKQVRFSVFDVDIPGYARPAPEHLPLPDPAFLALHAACCKVAHMSGAAEYVDKLVRDMQRIRVLAEDGGSADVLTYALSGLSV